MRRDMITPAHWLPTDDGKDCVGAAWELLRFQPHETQEQIHRRLGQWPLVCKLRKERNDMRSIKEQLKAGDNVWCVIHEPNRVVLGKVVSIGIFSQEMRYLISPDDGELLPLKSGSFLFRRRVLLHRFSTGVISGSPCPTER